MLRIAPSLLSADFARLAEEIKDVEAGGADWIHVDVMDGHFVPNLTMGPIVVESIRKYTSLPLDVHLMIEEPDRYIPDFARAGADLLTVHSEACTHLHRTLHYIKDQGVKAGVAINPATSLQAIEQILDDVDLVLIMTVNPGFGGQTFISSTLRKLQSLKEMLQERNLMHMLVEVDGGINNTTARLAVEAGANMLVAGNAVFGAADRAAAIRNLRV